MLLIVEIAFAILSPTPLTFFRSSSGALMTAFIVPKCWSSALAI